MVSDEMRKFVSMITNSQASLQMLRAHIDEIPEFKDQGSKKNHLRKQISNSLTELSSMKITLDEWDIKVNV